MLAQIVDKLRAAKSVLLSTHRQSDGDGLGAQIALFHGLKKAGIQTRIVSVDRPPRKYDFLGTEQCIEVFTPETSVRTELALILDTNDARLVEPLYSALKNQVDEVIFIDHHPVLAHGPAPTKGSFIDIQAASTGELAFRILKALEIPLDATIARALYTSLVFDTQLFRFVKSDPTSHLLAAELLRFEREPEEVHRKLFANYTVEKLSALIAALSQVEYLASNRIAFIPVRTTLSQGGLDRDESGDVIDQVMNINSIEVAALLREDAPKKFKLSLRSKGTVEVLSLAESFGGGGHRYASGAYLEGTFDDLRDRLIRGLHQLVPYASKGTNL